METVRAHKSLTQVRGKLMNLLELAHRFLDQEKNCFGLRFPSLTGRATEHHLLPLRRTRLVSLAYEGLPLSHPSEITTDWPGVWQSPGNGWLFWYCPFRHPF